MAKMSPLHIAIVNLRQMVIALKQNNSVTSEQVPHSKLKIVLGRIPFYFSLCDHSTDYLDI